MQTAISLARRGLGNVWPNPSVGCVLVREDLGGQIVGRGWTQKGGRPHAETEAIRRAGKLARGATAYVTLEPCCHFGETTPCTNALMEAGIIRVVAATNDPDPRVAGNGLEHLRKGGVDVEVGTLREPAELLNKGFISRIKTSTPLITLKIATTSDGYIATKTGESQWITGPTARQYGHMLRARHDAILTGIGTIEADDPMLTCRINGLEHLSPIRVIMDTRGRLSDNAAVAITASQIPVWRFRALDDAARMSKNQVEDISCRVGADGHLMISEVLSILAKRGITRLLVEAGPKLTTAFLKTNQVDKIHWFRSASIMGQDGQPVVASLEVEKLADLYEFVRIETKIIGQDNLEIYTQRSSA